MLLSRRCWLKSQVAGFASVWLGGSARAEVSVTEQTPDAASRVLGWLQRLERRLMHTRYASHVYVDLERGVYEFDCSGMAAWVLWRAAPVAHNAVAWELQTRPLARDFYRRIRLSPSEGERFGWRRIPCVADALPGDVIAWLQPWYASSLQTGHVAFITELPRALSENSHSFVLRVCDSSSMRHFEDTRPEETGGFGFGSILVRADAHGGGPRAYGWQGPNSERLHETRIVIGRPVR